MHARLLVSYKKQVIFVIQGCDQGIKIKNTFKLIGAHKSVGSDYIYFKINKRHGYTIRQPLTKQKTYAHIELQHIPQPSDLQLIFSKVFVVRIHFLIVQYSIL